MAKVLIVDDVMDNVKLLAYNLADEGHEILSAYSGLQALEVARAAEPDVILLDIMMPGMDGMEACRRLKKDPRLRSIPVIMVSAKDQIEDIVEGFEAGAHDYIAKPLEQAIIVARVRAAVRFKAAYDTIDEMNHQLEKARLRAEHALAAKSEFLANMSHEIRTPLTAILGFSEHLLGDKISDSDRLDAAHTIHRNGEHLLEVVNDILDFSKMEARRFNIQRIDCSPLEIVSAVLSLMRIRAEAKGIQLVCKFSGPIPDRIHTDRVRLRQVLFNLIGNAIKFTERGTVTLTTQLAENTPADESGHGSSCTMRFDITDTGIGMTTQQTHKLFQGFSQADSSATRQYGGSGLGLVISRRLAKMLGGDVQLIATKRRGGSHFRAEVEGGSLEGVHMIDNPSETLAMQTWPSQNQTLPTIDANILLVEDGADNQRLIAAVLRKAGARVTTADHGRDGVDAALAAANMAEPYDIILMDMQMPVMDGYEATALLRSQNYTGTIVALTAHALDSDRDKCIQAGCDDYTTKPIDRKKLLNLIHTLLTATTTTG